ncbi:carbonic anhydrase 2 [Parasteatoda tepidariorum]|uniref:carbonic anhydrase 2 n=1 Tax=Parasteatoda tepidariorum TaxID=114398 RepID=UPI001C728C46|nr:carbonic anhydrase 2 [Parasteatoda tepidariorum]
MSHVLAITAILFVILGISRCDEQQCKANEDKDWYFDNNLSNGPDGWGEKYNDCQGTSQSPIDIQTDDVEPIEDSEGLQLKDYDEPITKVMIENKGYTVKVTPNDDVERSVTLDGVPYNLVAFFFKWGNKSINDDEEATITPGSDHKIDGKQYAMEMQIEHVNEKEDKVIIAVLFDDTEDSNPTIEAIQSPIEKYKYLDDTYDGDLEEDYSTCIKLSDVVENGSPYFQYNGSLPLPPCTENIIWLILKNPQTASTGQISKFQDLYSVKESDATGDENNACHIVDNYRPIQELNDRTVSSG